MSGQADDFQVYDEPLPGLDKALIDGLTEHLDVVRPGLAWNTKPLEIAFYAPEDSADGKVLEKSPSSSASSSDRDASQGAPSRKVLGGLTGYTNMGLLFTKLLWVDNSLRGKGVGRQLMLKAEQVAKERHCTKAFVDTMDFQAPDFYLKLGYHEIHRVEGCFGRDIVRIYYSKDI